MNTVYIPRGKAKEYGDYALNIYTGCPHRCFYCFAPNVLRRDKEQFHSCVEPRNNIVEETARRLAKGDINGKLIHLCFTCDPYPSGYDTTATRDIIKIIKESGNHVQILTKGDGSRDFDLLDENDWYGITLDGSPHGVYEPSDRLADAYSAKQCGIKTWVSFEPVVDAEAVIEYIENCHDIFDKIKIGKLNYHPSKIDWKEFGEQAEALCQKLGIEYYIKESLRSEMSVRKE